MLRTCWIICLCLSSSFFAFYAQKVEIKLQKRIEKELTGFRGTAGVYVENLKTGKVASVNADTVFPTASTIKVPIMVGIFSKIETGELNYFQPLVYSDKKQLYEGDKGLIASLKDSTEILLSIVQMLSICTSDNSASLWLQDLAGTGAAINSLMNDLGFKFTRVNSRTPSRENERKKMGWGQTTPREMATLLVKIRNREILSAAACDEMYRVLGTVYYDDRALSQIPPTVRTASKQGMVSAARSEVVLVNAPHGDYVIAVYTKNQEDTSWSTDNEGRQLIKRLSRLVWDYYEPKHQWQPAPNWQRYEEPDFD